MTSYEKNFPIILLVVTTIGLPQKIILIQLHIGIEQYANATGEQNW